MQFVESSTQNVHALQLSLPQAPPPGRTDTIPLARREGLLGHWLAVWTRPVNVNVTFPIPVTF